MKQRMKAWGLFKPQEQDSPVYVNESRIDVKWTMDDWGGKSEGYVIRPVIVTWGDAKKSNGAKKSGGAR